MLGGGEPLHLAALSPPPQAPQEDLCCFQSLMVVVVASGLEDGGHGDVVWVHI